MNIILNTGTEKQQLELRDAVLMSDGQNFSSYLVVQSGGFQLERGFFFEPFSLERFIEELIGLDASLSGRAELRPLHDPDHLALEMLPHGKVLVSGEISDRDDPVNSLRFGFVTDQTGLRPFIASLRQLANSHAAA